MMRTKQKLMTAVAMLTVSAVMLTSASFAWFTISTNPEISKLTTQVVVNENLEIALDADYADVGKVDEASKDDKKTGNAYTWGNLIDLTSDGTAKVDYDSLTNKELRPATFYGDGKVLFQYPTYGNDGRVNAFNALITGNDTKAGPNSGGAFGNLVVKGETDKPYGYYMDFWVRTNVGGELKLSEAALRSEGAVEVDKGKGANFTLTSGDTKKNEALVKNIRFSVVDVTGEAIHKATFKPTIATAGQSYEKETSFTLELCPSAGGETVATHLGELTANTAQKYRVYVYLEGENVTNAAAAIDGTSVGGALNLQFKIDGVTDSMDKTTQAQ